MLQIYFLDMSFKIHFQNSKHTIRDYYNIYYKVHYKYLYKRILQEHLQDTTTTQPTNNHLQSLVQHMLQRTPQQAYNIRCVSSYKLLLILDYCRSHHNHPTSYSVF